MTNMSGVLFELHTYVPGLILSHVQVTWSRFVDILPGFFFCKGYLVWTNSDDVSVLLVQSLLVFDQSSTDKRDDVGYLSCRPRLGPWKFG